MSAISPTRATLIGFLAIASWGTLPLIAKLAGNIPPFLVTGIALGLAFVLCLAVWTAQKAPVTSYLKLPFTIVLFGVYGYFGFHFFYFFALQNAPPVQAFLVIELWPLLMVLFSAPLLGQKLRAYHLLGAGIAFAGMVLVVLAGGSASGGLSMHAGDWRGYACALIAALIWASFSTFSRKWEAKIPQQAVGLFCGASAAASLVCHAIFEPATALSPAQWGWMLLMGLGPVGGAFFAWNIGVQKGHFQLLAIGSLSIPLIGTLLLGLFGYAEFTPALGMATLCVFGGSLLGSADLLKEALAKRKARKLLVSPH